MTRRVVLFVFVFASACRSAMPAKSGLDETIAGWRRTSLVDLSESPDKVPATAIRHAWRASYEGSETVDVRVYQVVAPELGLDLVQKVRPPVDTAYFYFGHAYFVAVSWRDADRAAVQGFVRELEKRLSAR
jgi:hypothetical protein